MKRFFLVVFFTGISFCAEDIFEVPKKTKGEKVSKVKEQLAQTLEDLLHRATHTIVDLTRIIDDVADLLKQLAGQQDGVLAGNDKEAIKKIQHSVEEVMMQLQSVNGKLSVKTG